jgi:hypothetical protein
MDNATGKQRHSADIDALAFLGCQFIDFPAKEAVTANFQDFEGT